LFFELQKKEESFLLNCTTHTGEERVEKEVLMNRCFLLFVRLQKKRKRKFKPDKMKENPRE